LFDPFKKEQNMALMYLTIIPLGTQTPSVGEFVADIQQTLKSSGVNFQLTDMGTIVEGESKDLLQLAARLAELPFKNGIQRVVTQISLDDRRDKKISLGDKAASVAARLKNQEG
jgi:uncharacterized protein (TIGR00106 family)